MDKLPTIRYVETVWGIRFGPRQRKALLLMVDSDGQPVFAPDPPLTADGAEHGVAERDGVGGTERD